jgi:membrane protein YqaA with SNARE-associated domain
MPEWLQAIQNDILARPFGLYLATYFVCFVSGFVPLVNTEVYLLSVSTLGGLPVALPLTLSAALGQMTAKSLLYLAGRGVLRIPLGRYEPKLQAARVALEAHRQRTWAFLFTSALGGLPPFYVISVLAGSLRVGFPTFFSAGLAGRFLRFGLCVIVPLVFRLLL